MSIQAGVWRFAGGAVDRKILAKISEETAEYGPDGESIHSSGELQMLYRPYHTTRESRIEAQPLVFANGNIMTWDGRLDNREELSSQLGLELNDHQTDLAWVAAAFARWGTDCFAKLVGEWAVAIWDPDKRRLILARDYIGIRHLFYYIKAGQLTWSTRLEPLVLCGDQFTLCDEYVAGYFALWPDAHLTPYREICSVPPGKFICISPDRVQIQAYWTFNPKAIQRYTSDAEYEEQFRTLFRQAVRRRLRSDTPVLAELSGGFDSSSIVCMADDIFLKEGAEAPRMDTFSHYNLNDPGDDDFAFFTAVEQKRGRTGFHLGLKDDLTFWFDYSSFVATPGPTDRPEVRMAKRELAREGGYRTVLSGTGGDEMMGQALDSRVQLADLLMQRRLREFFQQLTYWSLQMQLPGLQMLGQCLVLLLPVSARSRLARTAKVEPWVGRAFASKQKMAVRQLEATEGSWLWLPSVRDSLQTISTLGRQMTFIRPSLPEKRYPYLDQTLVEFLIAVPTEQLLRLGERRSLMRRALADLLPHEITGRRSKATGGRCFTITLEKRWSDLKPILDSLLISRLGYVRREPFCEALEELKRGLLSPYFLRLMKALSCELWLRDLTARRIVRLGCSDFSPTRSPQFAGAHR